MSLDQQDVSLAAPENKDKTSIYDYYTTESTYTAEIWKCIKCFLKTTTPSTRQHFKIDYTATNTALVPGMLQMYFWGLLVGEKKESKNIS